MFLKENSVDLDQVQPMPSIKIGGLRRHISRQHNQIPHD